MTDFIIKKLPYDLSSHAGLAFIGKYLKRINVNALIDPAFPVRSGVANSDSLKSYLALLCLGKSDFDAIGSFRTNAFFKRALGLGSVASSPTLRQRMDAHASAWFDLVPRMNELLPGSRIHGRAIDFGALDCGYIPLDLDTFAMDNGGTRKELVGRTYTGVHRGGWLLPACGVSGPLGLLPGVGPAPRGTAFGSRDSIQAGAGLAHGCEPGVLAPAGARSLRVLLFEADAGHHRSGHGCGA